MNRRFLLLTLLLGTSTAAFAGDLFFGRRIRRYCHLPCYDYRVRVPSNPVSESSTNRISYLANGTLLPDQAADATPGVESLRTFQLSRSELKLDHCSFSKVAMTISDSGRWVLTGVARQDPDQIEDTRLRPAFERFRQNRFHLDVRPVGLLGLNETPETAVLGKPEFDQIRPKPFWVRKRQTIRVRLVGQSDMLKRYYRVLDQIEVHFSYE